jgi:hypothetical protein
MIIVRETTQWAIPTPNHVYVLSNCKTKLYGYVQAGTTVRKTFAKPLLFDARGRTFQLLEKIKK